MNDILTKQKNLGREAALRVRANAANMTDNELIANIRNIPVFNPNKDYSEWPVSGPVKLNDSVYRLLVPHNAADYDGTPETLADLWALCVYTEPEHEPTEVELLEEAICELDAEYDERITATEDAICELDMMLNGG